MIVLPKGAYLPFFKMRAVAPQEAAASAALASGSGKKSIVVLPFENLLQGLADQYSSARVEAAADRALLTGACRYQSVKSILKNSLDALSPAAPQPSPPPAPHDNIRGAEYFE